MTDAVVSTVYAEAAGSVETTGTVSTVYAEAAGVATITGTVSTVYVEVVVGALAAGGWGVGMVRMNP